MKIIIDFLRLIRLSNLLMVALTQFFALYFLNKYTYFFELLSGDLILLVLSTVLSAAAGYIINDYMDVKLDLINKPHRVIIGNTISRRWAMLLHFILNLLAVSFAYLVNLKVFVLVFFSTIILWLYSQFLKKTYLAGNIMVALLTALTLIILLFYDESISKAGIFTYSIFAFFTTLFREIIKDTEDMKGDEKFKASTYPIVKGVRKTKNLLIALQIIILILVFTFTSLFGALSMAKPKTSFLFIIYSLFLVCVPMVINLWLLKTADVKSDFSRLSFLSKINMLTGIFSMVFWKY
ncbi:MAG: geranylgeranylglycerol-phosphate geranylgeranyltransferase [Bacteroidia bacterium]